MQVTSPGNPPHETPEQLRARLLRCPKVKASVCKVARSHGVPPHEEEDVYQKTLLRVWEATLPPTEREARKYINGIAKFVAIDHVRQKADEPTQSLEAMRREPRPVVERVEQRTLMRRLFDQGHRIFGKSFEWFLRSKVHQETSQEIAAAEGVTPSHVRDEVSLVSRWFEAAWGKRTGIGSLVGALIAAGTGWWLVHRVLTFDESQVSAYAEVRTQGGHALDAMALRERGLQAFDEGAWSAAEHDLAAAAEMDPQGEAPEVTQTRATAIGRQIYTDANGDPENNAKPGR